MFNNRLLFALVCLPLFFNCAGHRQTDIGALTSLAHNLIPVYRTGFDVKEDNDGLIIEDFDAESPAIAVGMQKGDLIVSINGKAASRKEFLRVMQLNRGEDVLFTVKRCDQPIDFTITPKLYYNAPPSAYKVYELSVIDDRHVNLAVIVADVRNNTGEQSFSWEESMRHQVQQDIENNMLNNLDCQDNLSFADGAGLDEIIDAYRLNMAGLTTDDARARIGRTTGATHMLIATLVRNPKIIRGKESCEDTVTGRLMEIESGKVLAIDQSTSDCKPALIYTSSNR